MKNKYAYCSRISEAKIRQIVKLFSVNLTASQIAKLAGVNRNTVNRYVAAFRERIARYCEAKSPVKGEVEVDESYFGARRIKGVRGVEPVGKLLFLAWSSVMARCTRKLSLTARKRHSRELSAVESTLRASSTPMVGEDMVALSIWGIKSTFESSIPITNLPTSTHISMG